MSLSTWIILLAVALYGLLHSWLASLQAKALARQQLGEAAARGYRLAYNVVGALTLLPVLALPALLPDQALYIIPAPWRYLTLGLQGLALIALVVGVLQTGVWSFLGVEQFLKTAPQGEPRLVVSGLYRWVRHPLYTAGLVFIWLIPVMTANLLALNAGLTAYLYVGALFEERKLLREYGEAYAEYRRRTPMLVPGWRARMPPADR